MTKIRIPSILLALLIAFDFSTATAQDKAAAINIGLVDMERIFSEFYKTKIAEDGVEDTKAIIKQEVEERRNAHGGLLKEYEDLVKKIKDPTLAEAIRQGHQKAAEKKAAELRALDADMQEYAERRRVQLIKEVEASKAKLLNEISAKINEIAAADGFDAVFDRSGLSERGFPFVVFVKDATDISEKIVTILNADAPKTGTPATPTTPPKKSD